MKIPKFFRDPVHGQIRFLESIALNDNILLKLIDTYEFQRLRLIRQNALANFVFYGAEHSRFSHSLGVCYLAGEMYHRITRNMGIEKNQQDYMLIKVAALLHDIGHGPFSHTIEEVINEFQHEKMTVRIITEDTEINNILRNYGGEEFVEKVVSFYDKTKRNFNIPPWYYEIISGVIDADRMDYLLRDSRSCGLTSQGYDIERLLDVLILDDNSNLAVHERGIDAIEAYFLMYTHMYKSVYFHHANRSANFMLKSAIDRAVDIVMKTDDTVIIGHNKAVSNLIKNGDSIDLSDYFSLSDSTFWSLLPSWRNAEDFVLQNLSRRLMSRKLFKFIPMALLDDNNELRYLLNERVIGWLNEANADKEFIKYFFTIENPKKTTIKKTENVMIYNKEDKAFQKIFDFYEKRTKNSSSIISDFSVEKMYNRILIVRDVYDKLLKEKEAIRRI